MKTDKTILVGILFIMIAGILFITNALNPIIHPITHLFLMGSSKGKDIIFFGLMGIFLIASRLFKGNKTDCDKFLKISIILGSLTLIAGILLEVLFRYRMGIGLNTIFMSVENGLSSTSILHTHLLKSIFGNLISNLMGAFVEKGINTGVGLYPYVPSIGKIIIILLPILFITMLLSNRNRRFNQTFLISFFASCLLIGALDGGLFATPSIVGICGLFLMHKNGDCIESIIDYILKRKKLCDKCRIIPNHENRKDLFLKLIKRYLPYIAAALIILLRFSVGFIGAETQYYEVDVVNPSDNIELNDFPVEKVSVEDDRTIYIIDSNYNEMQLLNDLKTPLNGSCEYYTVSWNIFSYLSPDNPLNNFFLGLKESI